MGLGGNERGMSAAATGGKEFNKWQIENEWEGEIQIAES